MHVEVGDGVERPVEASHHLVSITALLPKHPGKLVESKSIFSQMRKLILDEKKDIFA